MIDRPDLKPSVFDALGLGVPEPQAKPRNELGQDEFFELMVAQLTNQDPLEPMDSEAFLAQVAQFSTVSGVQSMERSLADLAAVMESSQALQASTLVGRDVLVPGERLTVDGAHPVVAAFDVPESTGSLIVEVETPAGETVRRADLGPQAAGLARFRWDGRLDDGSPARPGTYVMRAFAGTGEAARAVPVLVGARVESVSLGPGGATTLNLAGERSVRLGEVRELL